MPPLHSIFVQAGLSAAGIASRLQMLGLLVAAKADLEIRDIDGVKALKFAANNGVVRLVEALLDAGADPSDVDAQGHNVLQAVLPDGDEKWSPSPAILGLLKERYPDMYLDARMTRGYVSGTTLNKCEVSNVTGARRSPSVTSGGTDLESATFGLHAGIG